MGTPQEHVRRVGQDWPELREPLRRRLEASSPVRYGERRTLEAAEGAARTIQALAAGRASLAFSPPADSPLR